MICSYLRDNQFVWESLGQTKLFEGGKEADKKNGQFYILPLKN